MATKPKTFALNGGHTAGIFADMSVDGPIIGTLVAVVDRAKNLPNRKTIGKQDPYCAARLGKEAKKTTTDLRGGQTPKWDQELRFTVHDSPDYYQLKMSVFNDDKKTDLIGEAWIDLKTIIVPGGGQSDMWQGLTCRGKYAGEIRVEITFYDSRPRPDKPAVAKQKQSVAAEQDGAASLQQRTPVKRRPLPSDPVTGEAAPATPPPPPPPAAAPLQQEHHHAQHHTPRSHAKPASHPAFIPSQSPLQSVEYNTPSPQGARQQPDRDHYGTHSPLSAQRRGRRSRESLGTPSRFQDDRCFHQNRQASSPYQHQHQHQPDPSSAYGHGSGSPLSEAHELPDDLVGAPSAFDYEASPPPPPPAHRSRQSSAGPEAPMRTPHDLSPPKSSTPMRNDVLKSEAHRHSISAYPGQPVFKQYDPASSTLTHTASRIDSPCESPSSRHQPRSPGYSPSYSPHHRSMQPTVEDAPDSPTANYRQNSSRPAAYQDDTGYNSASSVAAAQNVSRPWGVSGHYAGHAHSPQRDRRQYSDHGGHPSLVSPSSCVDYSTSSSQVSYNSQSGRPSRPSGHCQAEPRQHRHSIGYEPAAAPLSLSPGADPAMPREFYEGAFPTSQYSNRYDNNHGGQQMIATRGRHRSEDPPSYSSSPHAYGSQPQDPRSVVTYSGRSDPQQARPRNSPSPNPNPNPQHTIRRKSVSPAPPPSENRRLSDIPFGPDSYDAFNPIMSSPGAGNSREEVADANAKIITHDGREVDPSDHLPVESWAPEPDPKPKQASPEPRARPSLSGAQPMPPSGRRPLRIATRPESMPALPHQHQHQHQHQQPPSYMSSESPRTPQTGGRNRLQKKMPRGSPGHSASASASASASSPLAPISPDNYQERQGQYTPTRGPRRGSSYDYPNENYAPHYAHHGAGPAVPAKVPLPLMSGANGGADASLMEEMQRIDIGAGRSRRRGGY
ncbi:uncharacterized protein UV8b_07287 [Ustilaginoidea virens]|uniref:C2 domain-containing protein n=1 Tax=Ustilaginoidea virens TaxID=1159556 RepID=A0A1B5L4M8_USTVR|nr:uncharacterized protein UV8b_07287 [Ustilaginoidea virens]QUC23046.1 hypothetical protein UV8b_07287 [Ustilaginoidea virens]GAO18476.1 hypothetical protein UVI_02041860 [Ustilaginoidea virens]